MKQGGKMASNLSEAHVVLPPMTEDEAIRRSLRDKQLKDQHELANQHVRTAFLFPDLRTAHSR